MNNTITFKKNNHNTLHINLISDSKMNIPRYIHKRILNKKINHEDNKFDAVMCVGTFTYAHVKPHALDEFIRITKKNGLICFTINVGVFKDYGFDKKINDLIDNNKWDKLEFFKSNYLSSKDVNAWLGIYKVTK